MILKSKDGTLPELFKDLLYNLKGHTMKDYYDASYGSLSFHPVCTLSEISMEKNISVRKLRTLIKSGLLDAVKCGRAYYVTNTEKEKFLKYPTILDEKDKEIKGYVKEAE